MSENQLPPDDPRLTAYALGELDPTEQAALENLLFDSPEARAAVREIRELAGLLTSELRQEPAPELTAQQRAAILVAGDAHAKSVSEQVNHAACKPDEISVMLGLPNPPGRPRSRQPDHPVHSVRRFALMASIAALIVVGAIVMPPPPQPQSESMVSLRESLPGTHDLAMHIDSFSAEGLALPEGESRTSDFADLSTDGVVRFREKAEVGFGMGEADKRSGARGGRQRRLYGESMDRLDDSGKFVPPNSHLGGGMGGFGGGGGSGGAGRGVTNKPDAPLDGEQKERYYFKNGSGMKPQQGLTREPEGKPAAGLSVAESSPAGSASGRTSGTTNGRTGAPTSGAAGRPAGGITAGRAGGLGGKLARSERGRTDVAELSDESRLAGKKALGVTELRASVRSSMSRAEGLAQSNPVAARKLIEDAETTVKNSTEVDSKSSDQLLKSLAKSRESVSRMGRQVAANEFARKKLDARTERKLEQRTESQVDESLGEKSKAVKLLAELKGVQVESVPELGVLVITGNQKDVEAVQDIIQEVEQGGSEIARIEPGSDRWNELAALRQRYKRTESFRQDSEVYEPIVENPYNSAYEDPLSTFGVDVDTASYANTRRFLTDGQLPPPNAVRIEEFVNYFSYDYPQPAAGQPLSVNVEAGNCPWAPGHQLVRIALKGREIPRDQRPASNLVFLVDVSGSMQAENKLPLVKLGLNLLTQQMTESDRVAIVTYSDSAVQRLESTNGTNKQQITQVIDSLQAAGSTNGAAGIQLAYRAALDHFIDGGTNRVILCTDGDFNVGVSDDDQLVKMIQERARTKVFFSVFGFGMGNLKDGKLEKLADKGNGHYAYIDNQREAHKMFVDELVGTLVTIAKDVKLQVEFNPNQVGAYRLIGYENRVMAAQDFANDKKDAGDIGAGHTVTALYEIVPAADAPKPQLGDSLRYRKAVVPQDGDVARELLTVKLRYKLPEADTSTLVEYPAAFGGMRPAGLAGAPGQPDAATAWYALKLERTDPDAAAKSLRGLFGTEKAGAGADKAVPAIEADAANRRILVRGSAEQVSQVQKLLLDLGETGSSASPDFNWAAAVAAFGMILRDSQFRGHANFDMVLELAQSSKGEDKSGRRAEFIELVKTAKSLLQPAAPATSTVEPSPALTREQAEAKASLNGKYKNLLRIISAPGDASIYGSFNDNGHWEGTSYLGHDNLPPGYWVYVAPNWYIWGDK